MINDASRRLLQELLRSVLEAGGPFEAYFALAQGQGHALADALDVVHWIGGPVGGWVEIDGDEWSTSSDPILALVAVERTVQHAQDIVDRTQHFAHMDVAAYVEGAAARIVLERAFVERAPAREVLAHIRAVGVAEWPISRLVDTYSLAELAMLEQLTEYETKLVAKRLRIRWTALEAFRELGAAEIADKDAIAALHVFCGVAMSDEPAGWRALVDMHAQILVDAFKPVRGAVPPVADHRPVKEWLPILRRRGLTASAAALHLTESDSTQDASWVARRLAEGGYGDVEVFGALLANGIGNATSLSLLREEGWELSRLVTVLVGRGELLSDIRARLDGLGVARHHQRSLLAPHAAEDLLTLVLGAEDEREVG